MFGLFKRKTVILELTDLDRERYISILQKIDATLQLGGHRHTQVIQKLIQLLENKMTADFQKALITVDVWGGSGAVWEVGFKNREYAKRFATGMIELINQMERNGIAGGRVNQVKKTFLEDLRMY